MLAEKAKLNRDILSGKVALITGAGGGIGYEAARALAYFGATVIIAEIDEEKGAQAQKAINSELQAEHVTFFSIDLTDEKQIDDLYCFIMNNHGHLDILFNNATIAPIGAIDTTLILEWDKSYAVNLRAPVLLTQKFLPGMKEKNSGTIVFVPSSGAAPYMGPYEIFKTAQVELCNTLFGELEGTRIITYAIGPGLVKTETAQKGIETVSSLMGMTLPEFYEMNEKHMLSAEEAGVGFAVSAINAAQYNGQEIGSIQALSDAGILENEAQPELPNRALKDIENISYHVKNIVHVYNEQYEGWQSRSLFERQWVLRDFKKTVGIAADSFQRIMSSVLNIVTKNQFEKTADFKPHFIKLREYYIHQYKLLQGYEKNPEMLKKNSQALMEWIDELQAVISDL